MTYKAGLPKQPVPVAEKFAAIAEEKSVETWEQTEGDAR
jgi:sarcosine oxidase subunit delta